MTSAADEITNISLSGSRAVSSTSSLDSITGITSAPTPSTAQPKPNDFGSQQTTPYNQHTLAAASPASIPNIASPPPSTTITTIANNKTIITTNPTTATKTTTNTPGHSHMTAVQPHRHATTAKTTSIPSSASTSTSSSPTIVAMPPAAQYGTAPATVIPTAPSHTSTLGRGITHSVVCNPTTNTVGVSGGMAGQTNNGMSSSASVVSQNSTTLPVPIMPSLPPQTTGGTTLMIPPTTGMGAAANSTNDANSTNNQPVNNTNTVAEFLYQLTKMLTDDNREVIEWSNGESLFLL